MGEGKSKVEAAAELAAAGLTAGACLTPEEVVGDAHLAERNMLIEIERTDGVSDPVVVPGNPVRFQGVGSIDDRRPPWTGEHTTEVLRNELGMSDAQVDELRAARVIS
jgi:crotonobetainyl-CoA:carnitine CoA-transferase CaiB-like acyl-CoA transferase